MRRRALLLALAALPATRLRAAPRPSEFGVVSAGRRLTFPADHAAHPDYRTEWWYATGWLERGDGSALGFQSTFFRVRSGIGEDSASAFAPRQLLLAHAALADPRHGRLRYDQRAARVGFGRAGFDADGTVWVGDWRFAQSHDSGRDAYRVQVSSADFAYALRLTTDTPPLLNGIAGFSAKAADARHASYYYSRPQLRVEGEVTLAGRREAVRGTAWLDHEWSSELLPPEAQGWDWVAINFADGSALMAFRLRRDDAALWSAATQRAADGTVTALTAAAVALTPLRRWTSPRSGVAYPVEWQLRVGTRTLRIAALFDDQELDSRASTGAIYWEGAVRAYAGEQEVGRGYLELTGYAGRLRVG